MGSCACMNRGKRAELSKTVRESDWNTGVSMSHHDSNWKKDTKKVAQKHPFKIHCKTKKWAHT